jgi:hypothetical protein
MLKLQLDRGNVIHPLCTDTRNSLLLGAITC